MQLLPMTLLFILVGTVSVFADPPVPTLAVPAPPTSASERLPAPILPAVRGTIVSNYAGPAGAAMVGANVRGSGHISSVAKIATAVASPGEDVGAIQEPLQKMIGSAVQPGSVAGGSDTRANGSASGFTRPASGFTRPASGFTRPASGFTRPASGSTRPASGSLDAGIMSLASTVTPGVTAATGAETRGRRRDFYRDILAHDTIVAYYGNPNSKYMGILGEESIGDTARMLREWSAQYNSANGAKGVIPAFEIVYGTVYANADIGYLGHDEVMKYIDYAQKHGMLVILDHQLGKYSVEYAIRKMLPYLKYPCVNLAIDPEWKTLTPGKNIGTVRAQDINRAQEIMQNYMEKNGIPGKKILIVHQFNYKMISDRPAVQANFPRVDLILNADGFGPPGLKRMAWDFNVQAKNIPLKGFKLFFPKSWKSNGYDQPLMTPSQVMKMSPQPVYISYQ